MTPIFISMDLKITRQYFAEKDFWQILINSFWWVAGSISFQFILGLILALILNKKFKFRSLYQALVLAPWAVPGFLIGLNMEMAT